MHAWKFIRRLGCLVLIFPSMMLGGLVPAWVLQRTDLQATIVTTDLQEKAKLEKDGWSLDAVGHLQSDAIPGSGPLHRLRRGTGQRTDYLLETDIARLPALKSAGFETGGIVGHAAADAGPGRTAVIQFTKGEQKIWLVKEAPQARAVEDGWSRAGIHFWLY